MNKVENREWIWASMLIALSLIPVLAGVVRLGELATGAQITIENARFFEAPIPVALHIVSATIYCILGAFQFLPSIRRNNPILHKKSGRLLIICGLVSAVTGLWMTQFYAGTEYNSLALYWLRMLVGVTMISAICLGFAAILRRDFIHHSAWMTRAYALGLGAGTQVLTGLPLIIFQLGSDTTVFIHMAAGWTINFIVAEWIIHKRAVVGKVANNQYLINGVRTVGTSGG